MFYSNRKLMYDGDWRNDKREGDGKYIFEIIVNIIQDNGKII